MLARSSPVNFMNARIRLQAPCARHEFGAQGGRAVDHDAGADHAGRLAVIDAELGDLDAVGMQVTVYASAYIGEIFSRADNSQTGGIAGLTRSHRLHACTAQEQMKQTHD